MKIENKIKKLNLKELAIESEMSIKMIKHYLQKYELVNLENVNINEESIFDERHVKMLKLIKEINKSKYFTQPLASYYIEQIKNQKDFSYLPNDANDTLNKVSYLVKEIKELNNKIESCNKISS